MSHIFISYSRKGIEFAGKIVQALAEGDPENKLDTWIDWKSIPKGEDWELEIYRGIEEAEAFLFLISPDSVASEMCNKEIDHAVRNGKRILPIVLRDADRKIIHPEINKRNWIFCREGQDDFKKAIEETGKTIHTDYGWLKYHTDLQVKALKWEQKKDNSRLLRGKELREAEEQITKAGSQKDPQPTELQRNYLLASQRNEVRQRRQVTISLSAGLVIVGVLAFFAWVQRNTAISETNAKATALANEESARATAEAERNRAEEQARIARANELAAYVFNEKSLDLSLLLSVESIRSSPTYQAKNSILTKITESPHLKIFLFGNPNSYQHGFLSGTYINVSGYSPTSNVAFSPDGKILAIGGCHDFEMGLVEIPPEYYCTEGEIILRNSRTYQKINSLVGHNGLVTGLVFSPNGKFLISTSTDYPGPDSVIFWDTASGEVINQFWLIGLEPHSLAVSSDGKWLAVSDIGPSNFLLWDFSKSLLTHQSIPDAQGFITNTLVFSPDGKTLALGGCGVFDETNTDLCIQGEIILWDVANEKQIGEPLKGHSSVISSLAFSPDGRTLVSGSCVTKENNSNQKEYCVNGEVFKWGLGFLQSLPDTQSESGSIPLLLPINQQSNADIRPRPVELAEHSNYVTQLLSTPDGTLISVSRDKIVFSVVHDYKENIVFPNGYGDEIIGIASSPDGKTFAIGYEDGTAAIWNIENPFLILQESAFGEDSCRIESYPLSNLSLLMQPGRLDRLARIEESGVVSFWGYNSGQLINTVEGDYPVNDIAFSPDGELLATSTSDGQIALWNTVDFHLVKPYFPAHSSWTTNLVFSPDGKLLASTGAGENSIKLWDVTSFSLRGEPIQLDENGAGTIAFTPDGKDIIASGSQYKPVSFFDVSSHKLLASRYLCPKGMGADVLAVSSDGEWLALGCAESIVIVDLISMQPVGEPLSLHNWFVAQLIFSSDNNMLISAGQDGNIIFWDVQNHKPIGNPFTYRFGKTTRWATSLSINSAGKILASQSPCGPIILWNLDPTVWANHTCDVVGRNFTQAEWQQYFPSEEYHLTCPQWPAGE